MLKLILVLVGLVCIDLVWIMDVWFFGKEWCGLCMRYC